MTSHSSELRRCRPLLGTFVEIGARAGSERAARDALAAGFEAVERVHRLMSFHESASDVSRLNRDAARSPVPVAPWTYQVLAAANRYHASTGGLFDVGVAPRLQRWGYLPATDARPARNAAASPASQLELLPGHRVRFRRPARIDLGGIAKGFAVDRAVDAMQASGATSGVVNAGGDLRVFGAAATTIHVRHPGDPGRIAPLLRLANGAIATSAVYSSRRRWRGRWVSPLVDPVRGRSCLRRGSASVRTALCIDADALTKVLMILGRRAAEVLRAHGAEGYLISATGELTQMGDVR